MCQVFLGNRTTISGDNDVQEVGRRHLGEGTASYMKVDGDVQGGGTTTSQREMMTSRWGEQRHYHQGGGCGNVLEGVDDGDVMVIRFCEMSTFVRWVLIIGSHSL